MSSMFKLMTEIRATPALSPHAILLLDDYESAVIEWYNDICEYGFGSLTGDDVLDMVDNIRDIVEWPYKKRMTIWECEDLLLKTDDGLTRPYQGLLQEEIRFIPFLLHLARPIALYRLLGYSQDLVSCVSMEAFRLFSQGHVMCGRRRMILMRPEDLVDDNNAIMARNDIIEMLSHAAACCLYERHVTEDEHMATIRLIWKDLDDEPNFFTYDLGERTAAYNVATGQRGELPAYPHH